MADIKTAIEFAKNNPDTPFAKELRTRIESGKMDKELIAAGLKQAPQPEKKGGFIAAIKDIPSDIADAFKGAKESVTTGLDTAEEARAQVEGGNISPLAGTIKTIGAGLKAGAGVVGEGIMAIPKLFTSQKTEEAVKKGVGEAITPIAQSDLVKNITEKYNTLSDEQKATIEGTLGGIEGLTTLFGFSPAKTAISEGVQAGKTAISGVVDTALAGGKDLVKKGIKTVEDVGSKAFVPVDTAIAGVKGTVEGGKGLVGNIIEGAKQIPGRVKTNLAAKEAERAAVQALPTETARLAANNGINVADVQTVLKASAAIPEQKTVIRELVDTVKKFTSGDLAKNPIEIVGQPIVNRLKELDTLRGTVGKKLGDVAKTLGPVTTKETAPTVFSALKQVPGLSELGVSKKGVLDFSNTTLGGTLNAGDRKVIQSVFTDAVRNGTGSSKHKLRQSIFEWLGAAKKGNTLLTETQDKALEAIRSGLSTVLDGKNVKYKALSNEYRKIIQPINDMRKVMRATGNTAEDVLSMKAGLLARRLTSNAVSNPEIRQILKSMDDAVAGVKGATKVSVETLQDIYNVLDKYYDIAGKTGLKGQVKGAFEGASGVKDLITKTIGGIAGETDAVRQKALEKILEEVLK
jgi:hypothetical protein